MPMPRPALLLEVGHLGGGGLDHRCTPAGLCEWPGTPEGPCPRGRDLVEKASAARTCCSRADARQACKQCREFAHRAARVTFGMPRKPDRDRAPSSPCRRVDWKRTAAMRPHRRSPTPAVMPVWRLLLARPAFSCCGHPPPPAADAQRQHVLSVRMSWTGFLRCGTGRPGLDPASASEPACRREHTGTLILPAGLEHAAGPEAAPRTANGPDFATCVAARLPPRSSAPFGRGMCIRQ